METKTQIIIAIISFLTLIVVIGIVAVYFATREKEEPVIDVHPDKLKVNGGSPNMTGQDSGCFKDAVYELQPAGIYKTSDVCYKHQTSSMKLFYAGGLWQFTWNNLPECHLTNVHQHFGNCWATRKGGNVIANTKYVWQCWEHGEYKPFPITISKI